MQEVSSLHPHGRFLEEDLSDSPTNQLSANQASSGLHPLILSKVWVPASKDKAIDKILHRLREKKGTQEVSSQAVTEALVAMVLLLFEENSLSLNNMCQVP